MTGLRTQTRWLPTTGVSKSAGRMHPAWGAWPYSAHHSRQWVLAGLGLSQAFLRTCLYKVKGPSLHTGFKLQLILGESGLPCDFFPHLKIHGRGQVVSPSEKFQHLKIQASDHEGSPLILASPHLQPSRSLEREFTCLFSEIQLRRACRDLGWQRPSALTPSLRFPF